jgi:thiosulfate reductase cytochrome b subunit
MHKNATKCNKTISKWCKNKHRASKIIDTFETYHICFKKIIAKQRVIIIIIIIIISFLCIITGLWCTNNFNLTLVKKYKKYI